ncbi:MAG: hypothetical protein M1819_003029 [Sarea resinae]|nr:MAG: hypothetical protein M1819_003029 [Sarea resinae]
MAWGSPDEQRRDANGTSEQTALLESASRSGERSTNHGEILRDVIIGFSDGLTVPFALTAGLSSLGSSKLVIIGGLAEIFSGSISMGLGAYLAAATEVEHYNSERKRVMEEVLNAPEQEREVVHDVMDQYGVDREATQSMLNALEKDRDFIMDFELKLEKPQAARAWISALTMGMAYFFGGLIPMLPYFANTTVNTALLSSIGITVVILLLFGYCKSRYAVASQTQAILGALQTLLVGGAAAGASYGIVRAIDSKHDRQSLKT